ncbi:MAG TPA: prolyl oligopeptidase family serine peptidase [Polyangia bacterium]|nr:prolyl oligopeptidase family serine peptidase [Polyangia bacterium]
MKPSCARLTVGLALLGCSQGGGANPPPAGNVMDAATTPPPADAGPATQPPDLGAGAAPTDAPASDDPIPVADAGSDSGSGGAPAGNARREAFLAQLRGIVNPQPPLAPMLMPAQTAGGVVVQDFSFSSTPTWRVPGTLRRPAAAAGRLPVGIVLHETGGDRTSGNVVAIANALVARGFLTVAITGRNSVGGNGNYVQAMKDAYANPGHDYPFLYDTAWDVMRLIDYLVTRDDVDAARIGVTGVSKGGMETVLVAAADPRVAAAAPIIGVQSFKWELENNAFQARAGSLGGAVPNANDAASVRMFYDRVAPGLVDEFDGPDMVPLASPRPFIVIAGLQDPRNPMPSVQLVMTAATAAYARDGAADHLKLFTANVGHDGGYAPFHTAAVDWLVQWLGTAKP